MGSGYPCLIQADLCLNRTDIEVLNCGISGNRVTNLLARWKKDCINLRPDVISILTMSPAAACKKSAEACGAI